MAVTITASELETEASIGTTQATRLLPVATALVNRYAPDAPDGISNEAVIRFSAYSAGAAAMQHGAWHSVNPGGIEVAGSSTHAPAFRNCGAAALLSPWRIRNAGVVG